MKKIIYILIILTSCNSFINDWDMRPSNAVDEVLNIHENNYVKNLKIRAIVCENGGGGCFGISKILIGLSTEGTLTIDIARKIIVDGLLNLEYEVNSSNKLKEFLAKWPFPINNIEYSIYRKVNGLLYKYPFGFKNNEITLAYFINDRITYKIDKSDDMLFEEVYEETLDEAMEKLGYKVLFL